MPPYPTVTLKIGDRGDEVKQLQALLNRDYPAYSKLEEDGIFGPKTEAVIREFQRRAGLPVDGVAGPGTLAKLDELTVQGGGGDQKDCGGGVFAGPNTSCPFAQNVREKYFSVPGDSVEIDVYSPVTQQTYTMSCVRTGDRVTCRGGNNAVVTFSVG
jgi:peptidoglycan hydrolase-like protein with peptidoglycan-binding domain